MNIIMTNHYSYLQYSKYVQRLWALCQKFQVFTKNNKLFIYVGMYYKFYSFKKFSSSVSRT